MGKKVNQDFHVNTYFFLFQEVINLIAVMILDSFNLPESFKIQISLEHLHIYVCTYLILWQNEQLHSNM